MILNFNETHDRLQDFTRKNNDISACCQDLIDKRPFGTYPFYIFAHARTDDENPGLKRLIWQPRLTKPKAQTNSMLFKAFPGTDIIKVIWMIPARELWGQFTLGKMMQNKTVCDSIHNFTHNRGKLEAPDNEDLTEDQVASIYQSIANQARFDKQMKNCGLS